MALLWHRLQILLHLRELLLPFRRLSARLALRVDALNRSVERELRRLEIPAARRDVRVIEEQLNGVEIDTALQESAASFAPEIVHVQMQFRELLATGLSRQAPSARARRARRDGVRVEPGGTRRECVDAKPGTQCRPFCSSRPGPAPGIGRGILPRRPL